MGIGEGSGTRGRRGRARARRTRQAHRRRAGAARRRRRRRHHRHHHHRGAAVTGIAVSGVGNRRPARAVLFIVSIGLLVAGIPMIAIGLSFGSVMFVIGIVMVVIGFVSMVIAYLCSRYQGPNVENNDPENPSDTPQDRTEIYTISVDTTGSPQQPGYTVNIQGLNQTHGYTYPDPSAANFNPQAGYVYAGTSQGNSAASNTTGYWPPHMNTNPDNPPFIQPYPTAPIVDGSYSHPPQYNTTLASEPPPPSYDAVMAGKQEPPLDDESLSLSSDDRSYSSSENSIRNEMHDGT